MAQPAVLQGADEIAQSELLLNAYAARHARGCVADFLGYVDLAADASQISKHLTAGLWLVRTGTCVLLTAVWPALQWVHVQVWRFQGALTLASFLRKPDALAALARSLAVPRQAVVATVMQQLLTATAVRVCFMCMRCKPGC